MTVEDRLLDAGFDGVIYFQNPGYESALIGVTTDDRAVYQYDLMVSSLMEEDGMSDEEAVEWIDYNTIRALPYIGEGAPIIMYPLAEDET